jgi:UDP-glucose 4-epimerase
MIVTGASGFVGRALVARLGPDAAALSLAAEDWGERVAAEEYRDACVFHLAARVHDARSDDAAFERDNVEKSATLARTAAQKGARRLVFLSTIKVNGEETGERPFHPDDPPAPQDAYARSKWKAEAALRDIAAATGLEVAIVRSPLVVGPGATGNLRALLRLARSRVPLPLGALHNRRTLVCVDDLARLLEACARSAQAPGRIFLAGDPEPVSTTRLITAMRAAWGRNPGLIAVPASRLEAMAALVGQREKARRLTRSLEADVSQTLDVLGWTPAESMEACIARMARATLEAKSQ